MPTPFADILTRYADEGRLRHLPQARHPVRFDLTSNDYLNLAHESRGVPRELTSMPVSAAASRLLLSDQSAYASLEGLLEELYGRPALLFNSGYHANVGMLSALALPGSVIVCDRLIHASMIDGIRLGGARFVRYRHNDLQQLREICRRESESASQIVIATESIFSMDGDVMPLREYVALKKEFGNVLLYVDEAHAFGVRGERGLGVAEEMGVIDDIDILVGTFGKAAGSAGAFVTARREIVDFMLNSARSFIFSTALPPLNVAITEYNIRHLILRASAKRRNLEKVSARFRGQLSRLTGEQSVSESQIVPMLVGDARKVVEISRRLAERGVLALPIRYPTVARGTERIRFSLHSALSSADIDTIISEISEVI